MNQTDREEAQLDRLVAEVKDELRKRDYSKNGEIGEMSISIKFVEGG